MAVFFPSVIGQHAQKQALGRRVLDGRFPHALLIEGEAGSGKRFFATQLAAALQCQGGGDTLPCGGCSACKKVLGGIAPDVYYLDAGDRATISVDAVRQMRKDMYLSATEADRKVYVIEGADTMTIQAQNALLKVLEEPPTEMTVLLLAERAEALLTTILSRVQTVRLAPLTREEMWQFAESHQLFGGRAKTERDACEYLITAAAGRPGVLQNLAGRSEGNALLKKRQTALDLLEVIALRKTAAQLHDAFSALPTKRGELQDLLGTVLLATRDLCLAVKCEEVPLLCYTDSKEVQRIASAFGAARLFKLYDLWLRTEDALEKNANVSLTLSELSMQLMKL